MICAKCGKENEGGTYFCKHCGSLLESGAGVEKSDYSIPTYKRETTKTDDTTDNESAEPYVPWMNSTNQSDTNPWSSNTGDNTYQNSGYQNNGYENNTYQNNSYSNNTYQPQSESKAKSYNFVTGNYTPISMWGYVGYELLFSIPCIGLIIILVMAFSASNVNVKNFARSFLCFYVVIIVLVAFAYLTGNTQLLSYF